MTNGQNSNENQAARELRALREHMRVTLEDQARKLKAASADPNVHDVAMEMERKALEVSGTGQTCEYNPNTGRYEFKDANGQFTGVVCVP